MTICGRRIAVKVFECRHGHFQEPFLELSVVVDEREAAVVLEVDGVDICVQWDRPSCLNVVVSTRYYYFDVAAIFSNSVLECRLKMYIQKFSLKQ